MSAPHDSRMPGPAAVVRRILGNALIIVLMSFFALPLLWLASAPFDRHPRITASLPEFTLDNFRELMDNPYALDSLRNSVVLAGGTAVLVVVFGALAAYALSRVRVPGRDGLLYALLLLSSIVTGTAAMVPIFLLAFQLDLIDSQVGVILVLTGGLLPGGDLHPQGLHGHHTALLRGVGPGVRREPAPDRCGTSWSRSYAPVWRRSSVWAVAQVWGNFLIPFLLIRSPEKSPAAVVMYTFYTEGGQPDLALISTFSLLYSLPVVAMFLFVSRRYGFRFHGGIKC